MNGLRALGGITLGLALACLALAFPLHCVAVAAQVGGFSLLDGAAFGAALAMVTRTRVPLRIYLWLLLAALTLVPMLLQWPPGGPEDVHPWPGAPGLVTGYIDALRGGLFLLGLPYPFGRLGHHAPD